MDKPSTSSQADEVESLFSKLMHGKFSKQQYDEYRNVQEANFATGKAKKKPNDASATASVAQPLVSPSRPSTSASVDKSPEKALNLESLSLNDSTQAMYKYLEGKMTFSEYANLMDQDTTLIGDSEILMDIGEVNIDTEPDQSKQSTGTSAIAEVQKRAEVRKQRQTRAKRQLSGQTGDDDDDAGIDDFDGTKKTGKDAVADDDDGDFDFDDDDNDADWLESSHGSDNDDDDDLDAQFHDDDDDEFVPPTSKKVKGSASTGTAMTSSAGDDDDDGQLDILKSVVNVGKSSVQSKDSKGAKRQAGGRSSKLPRDLRGLLGQANLFMSGGNHESAIRLCMEVIRLAPKSPDAFKTLGMIYQQMGDMEKSLQFLLIGAYLKPKDADEWSRLADLSMDSGNVEQAITCLQKAIRADPENLDLYLDLCTLYEQQGDHEKGFNTAQQALPRFSEAQGDGCLNLAKAIASIQHKVGKTHKGIDVLEKAFERFPQSITSEDVNFLLELYLIQKRFTAALKILVQHCGVQFEPVIAEEQINDAEIVDLIKSAQCCRIPDAFPVDLLSKLIVTLIHLDSHRLLQDEIDLLFERSVADVGDLFLDVAEAFLERHDAVIATYDIHALTTTTGNDDDADGDMYALCHQALKFLNKLVSSTEYNVPGVWLRLGECYYRMPGRDNEALDAYRKVVALAPGHLEAKMRLSSLLQAIGRPQEAIEALKQDYDLASESNIMIHSSLLVRRAQLCQADGDIEGFIQSVMMLLKVASLPCESVEKDLYRYHLYRNRITLVKEWLEDFNLKEHSSCSRSEIRPLFLKLTALLYNRKRYKELQKAVTLSLCCPPLNEVQTDDSKHLMMLACLAYGLDVVYEQRAMICVRHLVNNHPLSVAAWNIFGLTVSISPFVRYSMYCLRQLYIYPEHIPLCLINAHSTLVSGSYKHALGEYVSLLQTVEELIEKRKSASAAPSSSSSKTSPAAVTSSSSQLIKYTKSASSASIDSSTQKKQQSAAAAAKPIGKSGDAAAKKRKLIADDDVEEDGAAGQPEVPPEAHRELTAGADLENLRIYLLFLIAITYCHIANQRFSKLRHTFMVHSLAFFKQYMKARSPCQEAYYNLGRAMHILGFVHIAIDCYKRVLELPPMMPGDQYDLKMDAAYNLSLIYIDSKNVALARYYRRKYIVI